MPAPEHPDGFRQLPSVVTWLSAVGRPPISRLRMLDAARVLALSSAAAAAAAGSEAAERRQRRPRSMSPTSPDSAHAAKRVRLERHRNAAQHGGRHSVRLEVGARVEALYADGYWYDAVIASLHFADQHLPSAAPPGVGGGDRGLAAPLRGGRAKGALRGALVGARTRAVQMMVRSLCSHVVRRVNASS